MSDLQSLQKMAEIYVCSECGGGLATPYDPDAREIVLRCAKNRFHQGYKIIDPAIERFNAMRNAGNSDQVDKEIATYLIGKLTKSRRDELLKEQKQESQSLALAKYEGITNLSRPEASYILKTIWPQAPEVEVIKAAIICAQYGFNPLMKHLYLIPFLNTKTQQKEWVAVLGIKATRLIAARKGGVSYTDGPRLMNDEEQNKTFGSVDPSRLWAIVKIKDKKGNEAPGYGCWPKAQDPYGSDKGNSKFNMAAIRAERNALDRLFPGELPSEVDTIEDTYGAPQEVRELEPADG